MLTDFFIKETWFLFSVSRCTNAMYTMQLTTVWAAAARHEDFPVALGNSAVFTCIGALGNPSRTGPLARKYLQGFPYSWSLRRVRQKISSIFCTVICNYPSAAQHKNSPLAYCRSILLVFVRAYSSINNKIISIKNYFTTASWGPSKRTKSAGPWARAQCAHWLRRPCAPAPTRSE